MKLKTSVARPTMNLHTSGVRSTMKWQTAGVRSLMKLQTSVFRSTMKWQTAGVRPTVKLQTSDVRSTMKLQTSGVRSTTLLEMWLRYRCFLVNFAKFLFLVYYGFAPPAIFGWGKFYRSIVDNCDRTCALSVIFIYCCNHYFIFSYSSGFAIALLSRNHVLKILGETKKKSCFANIPGFSVGSGGLNRNINIT